LRLDLRLALVVVADVRFLYVYVLVVRYKARYEVFRSMEEW
jgi:hypothetical protein